MNDSLIIIAPGLEYMNDDQILFLRCYEHDNVLLFFCILLLFLLSV